jgi:hypothetical protein
MSRKGVDLVRFWSQVDKSPEHGGCWMWTGATSKPTPTAAEYGKYAGRGVSHRVAYELVVGPIPLGLELDHLCRNTLCTNPEHLEPVTRAENMRRRMAALTHCKRGHELTPDNCIGDTKRCRRCARDRENERYWTKRRPLLDIGRLDRECKNGHPRTEENTYVVPKTGHRHCRVCRREREGAQRTETRELRAA